MDKGYSILGTLLGLIVLAAILGFYYANAAIVQILTICELTDYEPYYDCDRKWDIIITDIPPYGICTEYEKWQKDNRAIACVYPVLKLIFLSANDNELRDQCGRSLLEHEILHFKYYNKYKIPGDAIDIYSGSNCTPWNP